MGRFGFEGSVASGNLFPILISNEGSQRFDCRYSTVCSDVMSSMHDLVQWLYSRNCHRVGLYGVNPKSISDMSRLRAYQAAIAPVSSLIYYNQTSLRKCFEELSTQKPWPDALICTNGFAAISLVRRLKAEQPEVFENLLIVSCQESALAGYYAEHCKCPPELSGIRQSGRPSVRDAAQIGLSFAYRDEHEMEYAGVGYRRQTAIVL